MVRAGQVAASKSSFFFASIHVKEQLFLKTQIFNVTFSTTKYNPRS